jgi:hypothetical protein
MRINKGLKACDIKFIKDANYSVKLNSQFTVNNKSFL